MQHSFPQYYTPRPYQQELHKMWRTHRYGIAVLPRQTGKDVAASMEQCEARLKTPKTTGVYISLSNPMIRDILWDKTYVDPATGEAVRLRSLAIGVSSGYARSFSTRRTLPTGSISEGGRHALVASSPHSHSPVRIAAPVFNAPRTL